MIDMVCRADITERMLPFRSADCNSHASFELGFMSKWSLVHLTLVPLIICPIVMHSVVLTEVFQLALHHLIVCFVEIT